MKQSCCAYLRKSREDEERERMGKGETLARHEKIIRRLAEENGDSIEEWYREIVSGETIEGREEMKRLLRDLAHGRWSRVYVVEASRLGRGGGGDQEKIVNAFRYTGTELVTQESVYKPDEVSDIMALTRELRSSEDELASISKRLDRGKVEAAREGIWQATGRTPYGWRAVRIGGLWQLEPDEHHEQMLEIFDMVDSGMSLERVAKSLNSMGVPTPNGGHHWLGITVRQVVTNKAHCGYVTFKKRVTKKVFDPETFQVSKKSVKCDEPIVVKGLHYGKGGVSEELFNRVQRKLDVRAARLKTTSELSNPLAGILVCRECGYVMQFTRLKSGNDKANYYQHRPKSRMIRDCPRCRGARDYVVIDAVTGALEAMARELEFRVGEKSLDERAIKRAERELKREKNRRQSVMRAYEYGDYTLEEMRPRKKECEARISALEKELRDLRSAEVSEGTVVKLRDCVAALRDDSLTAKQKNDVLRKVVRRIDYWNDTPLDVFPGEVELDIYLR